MWCATFATRGGCLSSLVGRRCEPGGVARPQTGTPAAGRGLGVSREIVDQCARVADQTVDVDDVRRGPVHAGEAGRSAAQNGDGAVDVAALDVRDPDEQLGEALPQWLLVGRAVLPRRLEHL